MSESRAGKPLCSGLEEGPKFIARSLAKSSQPQITINDFQKKHGVQAVISADAGSDSMLSGLAFLKLLGLSRADVLKDILGKLVGTLVSQIKKETKREKIDQLLKLTFELHKYHEVRPITLAVIDKSPNSATLEQCLRQLSAVPEIMNELPLQTKQQIWESDFTSFVKASQPLMVRYITTSKAALTSDEWWPTTSSTIPRSELRQRCPVIKELLAMIGTSQRLYHSMLQLLRLQHSERRNAHYCSLRADLLMALHDRRSPLANADPMHRLARWLDASLRTNTIELTRIQDISSFLKKLDDLGDAAAAKERGGVAGAGTGGAQADSKYTSLKIKRVPAAHAQSSASGGAAMGAGRMRTHLNEAIDQLAKVDKKSIFAFPVSKEEVPTYYQAIKEPMDLATMRKKVAAGKYDTTSAVSGSAGVPSPLQALRDDFVLMCNNCLAFNDSTTIYYKEAKRMLKEGMKKVKALAKKIHVTFSDEAAATGAGAGATAEGGGAGAGMGMVGKRKRAGVGAGVGAGGGDATETPASKFSRAAPEASANEEQGLSVWKQAHDTVLLLADPWVINLLTRHLLTTMQDVVRAQKLPKDHVLCCGLIRLLQVGEVAVGKAFGTGLVPLSLKDLKDKERHRSAAAAASLAGPSGKDYRLLGDIDDRMLRCFCPIFAKMLLNHLEFDSRNEELDAMDQHLPNTLKRPLVRQIVQFYVVSLLRKRQIPAFQQVLSQLQEQKVVSRAFYASLVSALLDSCAAGKSVVSAVRKAAVDDFLCAQLMAGSANPFLHEQLARLLDKWQPSAAMQELAQNCLQHAFVRANWSKPAFKPARVHYDSILKKNPALAKAVASAASK